jgi:predicted DNA-binding transcriptional regulator YafY
MASTSGRALRLLSLLQNHRFWTGGELAERLDVSVRTLRRDVDRLRELGYPVDARRGIEGGYQLAAGAALPPLALDDDEAVALAIAVLGAAHSSVAGMAEASVRALAKIVQVMPKSLRRRVDAVRSAAPSLPAPWPAGPMGPVPGSVDPMVLTVLAQACRDVERVRFAYHPATGEPSERLVEPRQVVPVGRRWYLVGYDLDRADWRTFRLDRIDRPRPTGTAFAARRLPAADAATFVRDALGSAPRSFQVTASVALPAAAVAERIGQWARVEPIDAASCSVVINADTLDWAALALGMLGAEFRVAAPPEAIDHMRSWAGRMSRATAG